MSPSLSEIFHCLGDPSRRRMLHMLSQGDLCASEIADAFNMTKPSVSHHLAALRRAGLVDAERHGQRIVYTLNATVFDAVMRWIADLTHAAAGKPGTPS